MVLIRSPAMVSQNKSSCEIDIEKSLSNDEVTFDKTLDDNNPGHTRCARNFRNGIQFDHCNDWFYLSCVKICKTEFGHLEAVNANNWWWGFFPIKDIQNPSSPFSKIVKKFLGIFQNILR